MSIPDNVTMMLVDDNILDSDAHWLVCPTNAVGTMGAGLAKYFSLAVPYLLQAYKAHCKNYEPVQMQHFAFDRFGSKKVYCFHIKCDWREYSRRSIIEKGLGKLERWVKAMHENGKIDSIAIPALGCGKGQLDWEDVLPLLLDFARRVPHVAVYIYPPKP